MTRWDVRHDEASRVLRSCERTSQDHAGHRQRLETALLELTATLTHSPLVRKSLSELSDAVIRPQLRDVVVTTSAALDGASEAVAAYHEADLRMRGDGLATRRHLTFDDEPWHRRSAG
ncbi:MAG TPA: DUF6507 family protein [Ornithinimicrobium sp.]|uniref:DUF6507 family protein n=1 Tax=Ornithinimicrobium sp. TaxID=1977084 RepID=UPI002B47BCA0|nr:DUF6507 family protein [Ornithinimicrobium sp.]HKJ12380.1 DUF6507 family protein [Ornithinimicrobium sp.]